MNKNWKNFLLSINANIENDSVINFGLSISDEQKAYSKTIIADLSHYGLIEASGDDVIDFFQGQLTNDIKAVSDTTGQLSAYCNPKGRILATFRIFKRNDHYFLRLHNSILEQTLKRLRMFVMRSKVELKDSSDDLIRMGIAGETATQKLTSFFNSIPDEVDVSSLENEITLIKLPGNLPRYEAYGPIDKIKSLWQELQTETTAIGKNSWSLLTIHAGIPEIVPETIEAFVPQMVNLQAINSLSFTKGCYPGQEVVARMHYLGKLKRRLYIASIETDSLPLPGQSIMPAGENEQKAGQVVSASWSGVGKADLLAVLKIDKAENNPLYIESNNGAEIKLQELPYTIEST